ncbi:GntR family transcriptional regulator [Pseudonocardia sp. GCM10023141]|uniref:GntR family transcriptional regulator n=1 Tax=Pseudonocardia sp. GCM10023141 TaxID=3252653 RepID=UPI003614D41F
MTATVTKVGADPVGAARGGSVAHAAFEIRGLVLRRELLPGEQLRQEDLAQRIGISRGPIREALQVLAVEGVVRYERNRGYFIARFTTDEMQQLYTIRDLLESAMLERLPIPAESVLAELREINEQIRTGGDDLATVIELNSRFHDLMLQQSGMRILHEQLHHISRMTTAYQALSINAFTDWKLLASDHDQLIAALEAGDNDALCAAAREHRNRSLERLGPLLG